MRLAVLSASRRPEATAGVSVWHGAAAAGVVAAVFKLAISDGGRHAASLDLVQTAVLAMLIALAAAGRIRWSPLTAGFGAVIAAAALASLWSVRPEASIRELLLWATYLGIGVIAAWALATPRAAGWFADGLLVVAGWLCLIALFMFWGNSGNAAIRWSSTFYWPNPFAAFLLLMLPLALVKMLRAGPTRDAAAYGGVAVLLGVGLVFSESRGAWIAAASGLPAMLAVLRPPAWRLAARRALTAAVILAAAVVLLSQLGAGESTPRVVRRAASIADQADPSIQGRLSFWGSALRIFADHPLVGTGPGTFGAVHAAYQRDVRFYARDAHNVYLQTLAEMGVLGAAALAVLLGALAVLAVRALRRPSTGEDYSLMAGAAVGLLAFLVHSTVDMDWSFPANPVMASALAGILAAGGRDAPQPARPRRDRAWVRRAAGIALVGAFLAGVATVQAGRVANEYYVAGRLLARQGRWSEAAASYAQASRWNPLSARYVSAEAGASMQQRPVDHARAERALRRAMALDRMNAAHPQQLARVIMETASPAPETFAEAEALLRRALTLDPMNRPGLYGQLARLYIHWKRPEEAAAVYAEAADRYLGRGVRANSLIHVFLWPEIVTLVVDGAEFALERGNPTGATQWIARLLADDPDLATHPRVRALRESLP